MMTNKQPKRIANPLIIKILAEASPLRRLQNKKRVDLACRIDDLIKDKGYSYSAFAKIIDKQPSEITKWLSGTHNFTFDTLTEIAFCLNVEVVDLMQPQPVQIVYRERVQISTKVMGIRNFHPDFHKGNCSYLFTDERQLEIAVPHSYSKNYASSIYE